MKKAPIKQVDPTLYSGVGRAERRRIAKELAAAKQRHEDALVAVERLIARADQIEAETVRPAIDKAIERVAPALKVAQSPVFTDQYRDALETALAGQIQGLSFEAGMASAESRGLRMKASEIRRNSIVPVTLLACSKCHRPTPLCACVDSEGNSLRWD